MAGKRVEFRLILFLLFVAVGLFGILVSACGRQVCILGEDGRPVSLLSLMRKALTPGN